MIEEIKILLGDAAANYTEAQRIAIIKLNRLGTEGLADQGFSGVSESFIDGYPADIQAALNRKRKIKVV